MGAVGDMNEKIMRTAINLMTSETLARLQLELQKATEAEEKAKKAIGAAAGPESDWHDNAAYDHAYMAYDVASARLRDIKVKLSNHQIITPRKETDSVDVGNTVLVKFADESENEKFTILGPDDSATRDGWISYNTPVAKSILGKREGESGEFIAGDRKHTVKIIKILPGDF